MPETTRKGLKFQPRARLMSTLGRELISSDTVAVAELVKNSYDANARFVVVSISGTVGYDGAIEPESGSVSILDDGHGMDDDRIVDTWLEPATSFRRNDRAYPSGRRVLGEKGIGRFAAAKLGNRMKLISKMQDGGEVCLSLDWRDFDDDSKYLEDIELDLQVGGTNAFAERGLAERLWGAQPISDLEPINRPATTHGTLVEVTNLRSRWTLDLVKDVRRSLSMLVSPFATDRGVVDNFTIYLDLPDKFGLHGGIISSDDLLQHHHYSLSAEVTADGVATVLLTLKDGSEVEEEIDLLKDKQLNLLESDRGKEVSCGPFEIFLYVWDRDVTSMKDLANHFGGSKLARAVLDSVSGVNIYRDGFRVLPYGETGNDWLRLDARRVQNPTLRLSNNQIVGYLLIGQDTNPELVDQSNREGLVEGPALADLRRVVTSLLNRLETERYQFRPRRSKRPYVSLLEPVDLTPLRKAVRDAVGDDVHIQSIVDQAQRNIDDRLKRASEVLSRYHRLATLGKLVDMVVHELTQPLFAIKQTTTLGTHTLEDISQPTRSRLGDVYTQLKTRFSRITDQAEAMNTVIRRIEPFGGRKRGRPTPFVMEEAISEIVDLLTSRIMSAGITVYLPTTTHTVTLDKTELQEIIVNLLDNSIYWLRQSTKSFRIINIAVTRNDDMSLSIVIEDSGPGIPDEYRDSIFEPYFTTKVNGVGLGLAIAGEIVEDYYGGSLELLPPGRLTGAHFRVTLRKRVG